MVRQNESEEIIRLINNGFDTELLAIELDISVEEIQSYKQQLELRKFAKDSIKNGNMKEAIEKLDIFIKNTENNIVEKMILAKLKAYLNKEFVSQEELDKIEEEREKIGFSKNIDEILNDLKVQIPKRKASNLKKKEKVVLESKENDIVNLEIELEGKEDEEEEKPDYESIIKRYKEKIAKNPLNSINTRNLLAFTYFRTGKIDDARNELLSLIEESNSYTAYRQLIYLEKSEGNVNDAKLWAEDAVERFPNSIDIREQLISIAKVQGDNKEVIKQLKEIIRIQPGSRKSNEMLEKIYTGRER